MPSKTKGSGYRIIPLDPKTKKPLHRPQARMVLYGLLGPRGGVKPLKATDPQLYSKKDFEALNAIVRSSGKNFTFFQQYTNKIRRDDFGNKLYLRELWDRKKRKKKKIITPDHIKVIRGQRYFLRWDKKTKTFKKQKARKDSAENRPLYTIKWAAPTSTKAQRPALFLDGREARKTSFFFSKRSQRDIKAIRKATVIDFGKRYTQRLKGKTLREAVSNLTIPLTEKDLREGATVFWNAVLRIRTPGGGQIVIPRLGTEKAYPGAPLAIIGAPSVPLKSKTKSGMAVMAGRVVTLATIHKNISRTLRMALMDNGYSFTSLSDLETFADQVEEPVVVNEILRAVKENAVDLQPDYDVYLDISFDVREF